MNYKMMGRFIAQILFIEAVFMVPAMAISLFLGESTALAGFGISLGIIITVALVLWTLCKSAPSAFYAKEGLVCVGFS